MRYASATVKSYSKAQTKKALKEEVARINSGESEAEVDLELSDPFGLGNGTIGLTDLLEYNDPTSALKGLALNVSNAKRSWFATVEVKDGRLVVK